MNTLKISVDDFISRAKALGFQLTAIPWCESGFWIERTKEREEQLMLGREPMHQQGLFYIQEASSMLPITALKYAFDQVVDDDAHLPKTVLDVAAAPGSKTSQLAAWLENTGLIVANELAASRVKSLVANLKRLGVSNTAILNWNGIKLGAPFFERFDAVLLDAPCGGEGTVRKDIRALKDWQLSKVQELALIQKSLIESAFQCLKPGGVLVYSTCTLSPEENHHVVTHLLEQYPAAAKVVSLSTLFAGAERVSDDGMLRVFPQVFDSEGFFVAAIQKTASVEKPEMPPRKIHKPRRGFTQSPHQFEKITHEQFADFNAYYLEHFGFDWQNYQSRLYVRNKEYWLFPEGMDAFEDIRFDRRGIKLSEKTRRAFATRHECVVALGAEFTRQIYALTETECESLYQGLNITVRAEAAPEALGEVVMMMDGSPVGLGKFNGETIKNNLPRHSLFVSR